MFFDQECLKSLFYFTVFHVLDASVYRAQSCCVYVDAVLLSLIFNKKTISHSLLNFKISKFQKSQIGTPFITDLERYLEAS